MQFQIDLGLKSYDVIDADGSLVGTVRFNPSDPGLAARWQEVEKTINAMKSQPMGTPEEIRRIDEEIKAKIDYAFGAPVCEVFFGKVSALAMCGGKMVLETVLEALYPIIEGAIKESEKAARERMAKHTAAYKDTDAGLAPGQKA